MLLYILFGVSLVVSILISIHYSGRHGLAIGVFFASCISGVLLSLIIAFFVAIFNATPQTLKYVDTQTTKLTLRALSNDSGIKGQFYFLGSGYIGQQQVINYITQAPNGAIRVDSMPAAQATIFEDSTEPHLMIIKTSRYLEWALPWELGSDMHYDFHIPAGSVLQNYKVDVSK